MKAVDPHYHASAAPPHFPAEVTESNLDRRNAAPVASSISVPGRRRLEQVPGRRRLEQEQGRRRELVWYWNPPVFPD